MKNQVQNGDALNVTAPSGGFTSGNGYLIENIFGVAGFSCSAGAAGVLWLVGVYSLTKLSAQAWNVGDDDLLGSGQQLGHECLGHWGRAHRRCAGGSGQSHVDRQCAS